MTRVDAAVQQLVALFEAELRGALSAAQTGRNREPQALIEAADTVAERVRQAAYAELTSAAARYEAAPCCGRCGRPMQRKDRVWRPVLGLHGPLRGQFQRWRCASCGRTRCVGLERLGLRHGCEPRLTAAALKLCAHEAFELAEAVLAAFGVPLSDNTLQRLAHEVGGERVAARQAAVAAALAGGYEAPAGQRAPQRLYLLADGFKAKVGGVWREPRAVAIFETALVACDERGRGPARERLSLLATLTDAEGLAAWATAELARWGVARAQEVVVIGDGADWIWRHIAEVVPMWVKRVEILDWYHLCQHLATAAGDDKRLLEELKDRAWTGDTNQLLRQLEALRDGAEGERREDLRRVTEYV